MADNHSSSSEHEEIPAESPCSGDEIEAPTSKRRKKIKRSGESVLGCLSDLAFKDQAELIKQYVKDKSYPAGCSQSFRRGLRRRAKAFRIYVDEETAEERLQYGKTEHGLPRPRWLDVVGDREEQLRILERCHVSEEDGHHAGRDNTSRKVTEKFYWHTVGQDCMNYVRSCETCRGNTNHGQRGNTPGYNPPKTGRVLLGSGVWKQAGVAILGPFQRTHQDNKFLVVLWDYFTKWPEAKAIPYPSSLLIARFLYSIMTRLGWTRITFFDEAPDFVQEIEEEFGSISVTNQKFNAWEKPVDLSLDEPFNASLMDVLETLTRTHPDTWDGQLDWTLYQYRTSKHPVMGYTPFQLMYNRSPYDPINTDQNCETYEDHMQENGERKKALIKDARRILGNARLRHSRRLKKSDDPNNSTTQSQSSPTSQQQLQQQPSQLNLGLQPPRRPAAPPQPEQTRHQHPQQRQQQQTQQSQTHHQQQPPPLAQPPTTPSVHQAIAYQHQDHSRMQAQGLSSSYSYMDLPSLPCT